MILGIDLGQKTTGLATSDSTIATPYLTIKHKTPNEALAKLKKICQELKVDKIVIGFVEGKIKSYFEDFARDLKRELPQIKVILWDETLTTRQAIETMIKLQLSKKARQKKEHEIAAVLILQSYLDERD